jgi:hypothetical protein
MGLLSLVAAGLLLAQASGVLLAWHLECEHHGKHHGHSSGEPCQICSQLVVLGKYVAAESPGLLLCDPAIRQELLEVGEQVGVVELDTVLVRGPPRV